MKASSVAALALLLSNATSPAGMQGCRQSRDRLSANCGARESSQPGKLKWCPASAPQPGPQQAPPAAAAPCGWRSCGTVSSVTAPLPYRRITSPATTTICRPKQESRRGWCGRCAAQPGSRIQSRQAAAAPAAAGLHQASTKAHQPAAAPRPGAPSGPASRRRRCRAGAKTRGAAAPRSGACATRPCAWQQQAWGPWRGPAQRPGRAG